LIRIHIGNGIGGARIGAGWVAATQITLDHLAGIAVVIHCAERTRDSADLAADTCRLKYDFGSGVAIKCDGIDGAGLHTPGFRALRARIRHEAPFIVKGKDANSGFGGVEYAFVFQGTGKFTLNAASALTRVNE
jgi:hypothetical protein